MMLRSRNYRLPSAYTEEIAFKQCYGEAYMLALKGRCTSYRMHGTHVVMRRTECSH